MVRIIGLTGGISCGKSTLAEQLATLPGVRVIDLDALGHRVLDQRRRAVEAAFGSEVIDGGRVDRAKLGELVFDDPVQLRKLNGITRPAIARALFFALAYHLCIATPVVVLDAPLLFETGLHHVCAATIAVHVDEAEQLRRLRRRDGSSAPKAAARIRAQMSSAAKAARATVVVDNGGSVEELIARSQRQLVPWLTRRSAVLIWHAASLPGALLIGIALRILAGWLLGLRTLPAL